MRSRKLLRTSIGFPLCKVYFWGCSRWGLRNPYDWCYTWPRFPSLARTTCGSRRFRVQIQVRQILPLQLEDRWKYKRSEITYERSVSSSPHHDVNNWRTARLNLVEDWSQVESVILYSYIFLLVKMFLNIKIEYTDVLGRCMIYILYITMVYVNIFYNTGISRKQC